ncbi:hypothetical protein [Pseudofrankia asymbiotica]|uniref:MaoC-like domain-containing protein n=1 Tax=Pseudofrankia asymbiotica TaxID=1834516 RepID=A0A1V2I0J5_9ACTN|nr:hypothetical protein [Pseudofrankia asymbiotica]ONH22838.1 hypothetical protein BL253_34585 [Pseudofrankia asymbiotica]
MTANPIVSARVGGSLRLADVAVGDEMPVTSLPLTLQRLVIEASVNRDFTPTHHDPALAVASGAPAPYANTSMLMALLEAGLRNWIGLEGRVLELDFRMRRFNTAGSVLRIGGRVTGIGELDAEESTAALDPTVWGAADVQCWIEANDEFTVEGTARVALMKSDGTAVHE